MRSAKLTESARKHVHRRNVLPHADAPAAFVSVEQVNNRHMRRLQAKQIRSGQAAPTMIYTGNGSEQPFTAEAASRLVILEGVQHG